MSVRVPSQFRVSTDLSESALGPVRLRPGGGEEEDEEGGGSEVPVNMAAHEAGRHRERSRAIAAPSMAESGAHKGGTKLAHDRATYVSAFPPADTTLALSRACVERAKGLDPTTFSGCPLLDVSAQRRPRLPPPPPDP